MHPFARSLVVLCLVEFAVVVSFAGAPETKSQPIPTTGAHQASTQTPTQVPTTTSNETSRTETPATTNVSVSVDALSNRHAISPYVYGGAYPQDSPTITDSGLSVVRWGGNSTSRYNWQLFTYNAANDYYFEDFNYSEIGEGDSTKFITDVKNAGSHPLMTMVMLPWVAQSAENGTNGHWSFSVAKYGSQCSVDPFNTDAGDGLKTDCSTTLTANPNDANVPILDQPGTNDPPGSVYRNQWAPALASAFGTAPHFYDMDNEIDIWGSTQRDVHPSPTAYNEMRDTFVTEARALKGWDPKAIRLGPVSCCWWFYWNGADGNDKGAHAGVDLLPWWLNEVYWEDKVAGVRSVDVLDVHAYPDGPDTSSWTQAQKQALAARIYRDYWDPTYVSESSSINQEWATFIQPNKTIPFRIPRIRATANMIYPGTPVSFTEWSAAFAGESDFSTALGDADAYGILGRERMYLATRWVAPLPTNPNYLALKLFTNYDGLHHGFATTSVSDTNNGDPNLFSSYAALNSTGKMMTLLLLNKDPSNTVQAQFTLNGFTPQQVTSYTLASTNSSQIVKSKTTTWSSTVTVAPYTAALLVVTGTAQLPGAEWDLNPDTTMVPAGGNVVLQPKVTAGTATVTLGTPQADSGITVTVSQPTLSKGSNGKITVTAGTTPGFYHYSVPSTDTVGVAQQQGGYILVGNPPATFTKTGDKQKGAAGSQLTLSVTLIPGQSGGSAGGGTVLFTTNAGSLASRTVTTDSTGKASVVLTLPSTAGSVRVTAEGQYALGHPSATFTETAQ
jgi:Glycoside hydrolase family 44